MFVVDAAKHDIVYSIFKGGDRKCYESDQKQIIKLHQKSQPDKYNQYGFRENSD